MWIRALSAGEPGRTCVTTTPAEGAGRGPKRTPRYVPFSSWRTSSAGRPGGDAASNPTRAMTRRATRPPRSPSGGRKLFDGDLQLGPAVGPLCEKQRTLGLVRGGRTGLGGLEVDGRQ